MISKIKKSITSLDVHTLEVLKKSSASTLVKVGGMVVGFLVSIFLGRTIGADGLGIINLSNRIINILIVIGLVGIPQTIIKEVAIAQQKEDYKHIGDVMFTSYLLNGVLTLIISIILIALTPWIAENIFYEPRLTYPLMIMLVALTPQIFSRIFSAGLVGFRKIWQANLVDQTLSITVTGVFLLLLFLLGEDINIINVALAYFFGRVVVTLSIGSYWRKLYKSNDKKNWIAPKLLRTSLSFMTIDLAVIINANISVLLLGALVSSSEVGLFTVANRIALLTSFFLLVTNTTLSPKIAALYERKKINELQTMIQKVTGLLTLLGMITLFVFIFFGNNILSLWGGEFVDAYIVLLILSIGQFVNLATGAVGLLLKMTGYEKIHKNISLGFMFLSLPLTYLFIMEWGIFGAALIFALFVAAENILKLLLVKKYVGILTIPRFK